MGEFHLITLNTSGLPICTSLSQLSSQLSAKTIAQSTMCCSSADPHRSQEKYSCEQDVAAWIQTHDHVSTKHRLNHYTMEIAQIQVCLFIFLYRNLVKFVIENIFLTLFFFLATIGQLKKYCMHVHMHIQTI